MTTDALAEFLECYPGLAFIADDDGTLLRVSQALAQCFGERLAVGAQLAASVVAEDRDVVAGFLCRLADTEDSLTCSFRVPGRDEPDPTIRCVARRSSTGTSIVGQLELLPKSDETSTALRIEHALLRTLMQTLDIVLWAIDRTGKFVFHDGKALTTAGLHPGQFLGLNIFDLYPPELVGEIRMALDGTTTRATSEVHGVHWKTWNIPVKNDAGETDYCAGLSLDVTASVLSEIELKRQLETIRAQQHAIHELSAPLLRVWDKVVTVPLIGSLDAERANDIAERLLAEVNRSHTRFAILDLTGIDTLDTSIANRVLRLLGSLRLLGVEGMISGISPQVALTMVGLGIDLASVNTHRSLREALHYCMQRLQQSTSPVR